jgi:exodeoxyribonuclease V beta subunit
VEFENQLAYSASAGSGKTFTLSVRYLSLLFLGEDAATILAATFTNKAAAEMKERVIKLLTHLEEREVELAEISKQTGFSKEELLVKQPEVLANFLSSSNYIVTLDSFFTAILRSASLYIDIEPDFVTKEIDNVVKEENFLAEIEANSLLHALVALAMNIEDKRFVKMFGLMQNFYKLDPLLPNREYIIYTLEEVESEIEEKRDELYRAVVNSGASKTAMKNFEPVETKVLFKKSVFGKASLYEHRNYKKYAEQYPFMEELFLELKALLAKWAKIKEEIVLHNLFQVYDYYKNANISTARELGVLSFDDLTYFTHRLLHESINKEFLYFKIDSRFRHILLDEFQDTATLQFLLLKPLIDEVVAGHGSSEFRSFFYVGDTKQSLYRFRGGVEELFNAVAVHYDVPIKQMDTNYRSSRAVVEQVNRWFELYMKEYVPQKSKEGAKEGFVTVIENEELVEEAIKQLEFLLSKNIPLQEITFLVATNKDGSTIQEACYDKGYATSLKTSSSLKHTAKVAGLVSMVRYLFEGLMLDAKAMLQSVNREIQTFDLTWFHPFMQPVLVLHRLIQLFGYFEEDMNLLKLLEFASDFSDIPTFLEEFELSQIDVARSVKNGAQIMTIHGSKGLEFEHVIVVDRLKQAMGDRSTLLYKYDEALHVEKVFYKMSGRDSFDEEYRQLTEKQKKLNQKDKMNVLYVALTRAVESMSIIKKEKSSMFDLLGIAPIVVGKLETKPVGVDPCVNPNLESITITNYGTQEIEKVEEEEEKDYEAILFGTALHYTLEMMSSFSIIAMADAMVATRNRYGQLLSEDKLGEIKKRVLDLVTNQQFQRLLEGATLSLEQSLSYEDELKQIDLLLTYEEKCVVIDYKSSKKYHLKHLQQVRHYTKAIQNIVQKPTTGIIVYLLEEGTEFVGV